MAEHDAATRGAVTLLLDRAQRGDRTATDELFPLVYDELRALAARTLDGERIGHTLQPTALVNEAYLRLVGPADAGWQSRAHFFGAAAKAIRRILTDHARTKGRLKRGGGRAGGRIPLDEALVVGDDTVPDLVALDEALERLGAMDAQKARVVELRFFAGLSVEDVARALGVSESTVARDWRFARVWLHKELGDGAGGR
ncbi:MAG: sigma-70 family RNA polymerase sigma factor [Phycisphaerales bacterium]